MPGVTARKPSECGVWGLTGVCGTGLGTVEGHSPSLALGTAGSLHTVSEGRPSDKCPTDVPCRGLAPSSAAILFPAWPSASAPPPGEPLPGLGCTNFGDLAVAKAVASTPPEPPASPGPSHARRRCVKGSLSALYKVVGHAALLLTAAARCYYPLPARRRRWRTPGPGIIVLLGYKLPLPAGPFA